MDGESSYRRFLEGDDEGLVRLIEDHKGPLTLFLCSVTGDVFLAEDIIKDTNAYSSTRGSGSYSKEPDLPKTNSSKR